MVWHPSDQLSKSQKLRPSLITVILTVHKQNMDCGPGPWTTPVDRTTMDRSMDHPCDQKGKYSQKRTRESTILKSKEHLVTSGSRVWPVTIFYYSVEKFR